MQRRWLRKDWHVAAHHPFSRSLEIRVAARRRRYGPKVESFRRNSRLPRNFHAYKLRQGQILSAQKHPNKLRALCRNLREVRPTVPLPEGAHEFDGDCLMTQETELIPASPT